MHINKNKTGMAFGTMIGGIHLVWSILVALGWAQPLADFIAALHMIKPGAMIVDTFNLGTALLLVIITSIIGYVLGYVFASVWNRAHR